MSWTSANQSFIPTSLQIAFVKFTICLYIVKSSGWFFLLHLIGFSYDIWSSWLLSPPWNAFFTWLVKFHSRSLSMMVEIQCSPLFFLLSSFSWPVSIGMSQASVLKLLLLYIFGNSLDGLMKDNGYKGHLYADDSKKFYLATLASYSSYLLNISVWMSDSHLKFIMSWQNPWFPTPLQP